MLRRRYEPAPKPGSSLNLTQEGVDDQRETPPTLQLSWRFKTYFSMVIIAGVWLLIASLPELFRAPVDLPTITILAILAVTSEFLPIRTYAGQVTYNLRPAFLFAAALLLLPVWITPLSLIIVALCTLITRPRMRFLEPAFNFAQLALSGSLASVAFRVLGGDLSRMQSSTSTFVLFLTIGVFMIIQTLLVTGVVIVYQGIAWRDAITLNKSNLLTDLLTICGGGIIAVMWRLGGWNAVLALAPLLGLYLVLRLSQDVRHLQEVDLLKTKVVTNLSHELRTPLASIKLYSQLLQTDSVADTTTRGQLLGIISQQTDRLISLIDDMLDLSRLESGQARLHREPIDIKDMINTVVEQLGDEVQQRGITVRIDIQPDLTPLLAERRLIRILLRSLLLNAFRFSNPGGQVQILTYEEGRDILISVIDQGTGIPADALPHIFEKFYQPPTLDESTESETGLGLALAREAAAVHNGVIEVESEVGVGSRFTVRFPRGKLPGG